MTASFVWNTGRFGYGGKLGGIGGGINPNRINHVKTSSPSQIMGRTFKRHIKDKNWDKAFDVAWESAKLGYITPEHRDKVIAECIPFMADCLKKK